MDFTFGIVAEGVTDQTVIESILFGFCENKNLQVDPLQPIEENREKAGWTQVLEYIKTQDFKGAFDFRDYVVIQLDSDVFETDQVGEGLYRLHISQSNVEEKVDLIRKLLISTIGEEFYVQKAAQILFAIAVGEVECWLLRIYFPTKKAKAGKTSGCIKTLNDGLKEAGADFYIDLKNRDYYRIMSKSFQKRVQLLSYSKLNSSLSIFLKELEEKVVEAKNGSEGEV